MNNIISTSKIYRVSLDWANLVFKHYINQKELHITKRKHSVYYGYIDLSKNVVVPNSHGGAFRLELESILKDLVS